MAELTVDRLKEMFDEISELVIKADFIKQSCDAPDVKGDSENKKAYEFVYNDFLWKIQRKVGQLHFFVSGFTGYPMPALE